MRNIPPFHAMAMARLAAERAAAGADVLHLEVGQPSSPAPAAVRAAARDLLERSTLGYTDAAGVPALRRRIAGHYADWYGLEVDPGEVLVTAGASAGFVLTFLACFDQGARVGVVEPGYPCYRNTLLALGMTPVPVPVGPETRWAPTPDLVASAGPLDGLVVASPSNPTGTVLAPDALDALAAHCREHGIRLVSDEIYHGITYQAPATTARTVDPGAVVLNSFSKYFSMTGWRLGWIVAPADLVPALERFQQNLYICAPALSQLAAVHAFECHDELRGHVARYADNREVLLGGLRRAALDRTAESDGAFYVYADVGHLLGDDLPTASALCERWLADLGVAATPGIDFDTARGERSVRFSYAGRADDLAEAGRRLGSMDGGPHVIGAEDAPLADLRVVDLSSVIAGPNCARYLADFGADVVKVERPEGDSLRNMAWRDPRDGSGLWWKYVNRNKRVIALDLKQDEDRAVLLRLLDEAHVLVENFRPGTLERLGLGPDVLHGRNPQLVLTRVTGFGQDGPYAGRPGFATIAEAMSGYSAISGEADGPPLLPPIALTDEVTGLVAAFATLVAVHSGVGQVVDVNLLESLFQLMGPLPSVYALTGEQQPRLGSGIPYTVPRGTYRCADGRWVAISTSSDSVAARVMRLIGVDADPRFTTFAGRVDHRDELDALVASWVGARDRDTVLAAFEQAEAAIGPVMDMADVAADPHYAAREALTVLEGTPMQGLIAHLSATPGRLRWAGRAPDADGDAVRRWGWRQSAEATPTGQDTPVPPRPQ